MCCNNGSIYLPHARHMRKNDIVTADRTVVISGRVDEGVLIIPVLVEECLDSVRLKNEGTDDFNVESAPRSRASGSHIEEIKINDAISSAPHSGFWHFILS